MGGADPARADDGADAGAEARFAELANSERAGAAVPTLVDAGDLVDVARRHAERMADAGRPYHNPALGDEVGGWELLAENVGAGAAVDPVHGAFMESATHRDNILDARFTEVGMGVAWRDGILYVAQVFRRPAATAEASSPAPPPAAPPPPADAPAAPASAPPAPEPSTAIVPAASPAPAPAGSGRAAAAIVPAAAAGTSQRGHAPAGVRAAAVDPIRALDRPASPTVARWPGGLVTPGPAGGTDPSRAPAAGAALALAAAVVLAQGVVVGRKGVGAPARRRASPAVLA